MNIQQLRAQIAALQDATMDENKNFRSSYDEGKFDALSAVDALLDSLQEEPVGDTQSPVVFYGLTGSVGNTEEEPVSEGLEKAAEEYYNKVKYLSDLSASPITTFKAGAKWQAEQFENNRLKHCDELTEEQAQMESDFVTKHLKENNRTPTFIDAIEYGMRMQKEQIMKDAFECEVKVDAGGYPYIDRCIELYDYDKDIPLAKEGDKVKIVVIKGE